MAKAMNKRDRSMFDALDAMNERWEDAVAARDRYWNLYQEVVRERDWWRDRAFTAEAGERNAERRADYAESKNAEERSTLVRELTAAVDAAREIHRNPIEVVHGKGTL